MKKYNEVAHRLINNYLGKVRYEDICRQFGLDKADKELLNEIISRWRPENILDDSTAVAEEFSGYANIGKVLQALALISREIAGHSELRRQGENN